MALVTGTSLQPRHQGLLHSSKCPTSRHFEHRREKTLVLRLASWLPGHLVDVTWLSGSCFEDLS